MSGWTTTADNVTFTSEGAEFIITAEGQAPTIETDFYFFFGKAEVVMKAAAGTGICSAIVLESDVLDEIDWVSSSSLPLNFHLVTPANPYHAPPSARLSSNMHETILTTLGLTGGSWW